MSMCRLRLALVLISVSTVGLELALMHAFAFHFWEHLAYMVVSVALLGFGASGTALAFLRQRVLRCTRTWLFGLAAAFAIAALLAPWVAGRVPLNIRFAAWSGWEAARIGVIQLILLVPFLFAGGFVGVALTDRPQRLPGHYAANLIGSGMGGPAALLLLFPLGIADLFTVLAAVAWAGAVMVARRSAGYVAVAAGVAGLIVLAAPFRPWQPVPAQNKDLRNLWNIAGSRTVARAEGPLGRIDVVAQPQAHAFQGRTYRYLGKVAPYLHVLVDGDRAGLLFDCQERADWTALDQTTSAAAYRFVERPRVLVVGAGAGEEIGLARFHRSSRITAIEMNQQLVELMRGPLRRHGGRLYTGADLRVVSREPRGFLRSTSALFDIIHVPPVGGAVAGLHSTQESTLYTVEAFELMLQGLTSEGVLAVTRWSQWPPREGIRVFDTALLALRRHDLEPSDHLMLLDGLTTVTVLATRAPRGFTPDQVDRIRSFCRERDFRLCWAPGLSSADTQTFDLVDQAYHDAAAALVGPERERFLREYLFNVRAVTDDRPYFFHTLRWGTLAQLQEELLETARAFTELGTLLVIAALMQSGLLASIFIVLPLCFRHGLRGGGGDARERVRRFSAVFAYFALIGLGFMLLEMCFLQRLGRYLAHPLYSATTVVSGFLLFAGLGSLASRWWRDPARAAQLAAAAVALLGVVYGWGLDGWLTLSQACELWLRFVIAAATIAPLAFLMGHMFPSGMRQVSASVPGLVPWAWGINGFASVLATVATPLLAMELGFTWVTVLAFACYLLAGMTARWIGDAPTELAPGTCL